MPPESLHASPATVPTDSILQDVDRATDLYRALVTPRLIEDKMLRLIRQNRLSKWFSGYGQEAIAVGCSWALRDNDWLLPMHRNLGVWTTRGAPLKQLFCQLMGREGGYTKGRDRTFHFGLPSHHIIGMISHLGAMLPVADGLALGSVMKGEGRVACAFTGEGATREGDFHEALSLASMWKLPVIFIVENNGYGLSTPAVDAVPVEDIADAAVGYGMAGEIVDGNDVLAVVEAVSDAAERGRDGKGPTLLEMKTFRMRGHEEASGTKYVPKHLFDEWKEKDPIELYRRQILEQHSKVKDVLDAIDDEISSEIEEIAEWAIVQSDVASSLSLEEADVFAPVSSETEGPFPRGDVKEGSHQKEVRFIDALSQGLFDAMTKDERVVLLGQDIAEYGGVFKVTNGFLDTFGSERVRNTPIIESGAIGCAMGLALEGFKPVLEMQYADFITCGFNQIVNNLASTHYRWGTPLNVTIRAPFGGGIGAGPFHSQSPEAWFCHVPGLKVVIPGSPEDAKGLIRSAIEDPNPVLFFEHKYLYRSERGLVPEGSYSTPLGTARVVKGGHDATIATWGVGVRWALDEAERLSQQGRLIEVIDLRTLIPWDRETVLSSLRKTNRLLVLHEATRSAGFGAEIASQLVEEAFEHLDAPPVRVASEATPVPFSKSLEEQYSAKSKLAEALNRLLVY